MSCQQVKQPISPVSLEVFVQRFQVTKLPLMFKYNGSDTRRQVKHTRALDSAAVTKFLCDAPNFFCLCWRTDQNSPMTYYPLWRFSVNKEIEGLVYYVEIDSLRRFTVLSTLSRKTQKAISKVVLENTVKDDNHQHPYWTEVGSDFHISHIFIYKWVLYGKETMGAKCPALFKDKYWSMFEEKWDFHIQQDGHIQQKYQELQTIGKEDTTAFLGMRYPLKYPCQLIGTATDNQD